jgi:hypothetical protein
MILGMGIQSLNINVNDFETYLDDLIANKMFYIRLDIFNYTIPANIVNSKLCASLAISKGLNVIWGVSTNNLTAANWNDFRLAILDAAQWAQDNGVYEFQLGNEEEYFCDGTTLTIEQFVINLKSVATEVQAIFTRGNVSYAISQSYINYWTSTGLGDIDLLGVNIYKGTIAAITWRTRINTLIAAFGLEGFYLSEFSVNATSLDTYSTDEYIQSNGVKEMIDYFNLMGVQAIYFFYYGLNNNFGARNAAGNYRQLWDVLIKETGAYKYTSATSKIRGLSHG